MLSPVILQFQNPLAWMSIFLTRVGPVLKGPAGAKSVSPQILETPLDLQTFYILKCRLHRAHVLSWRLEASNSAVAVRFKETFRRFS